MKERKMMKQEEDRMEERKHSSERGPRGGNLSARWAVAVGAV